MPVNIHGKSYVTVAERLLALQKDWKNNYSLTSEVLTHDPVLVKATLTLYTKEGERSYTGLSAANPNKSIEKQTPYEVAESSAWGRALAAAGYGSEESIASADEMVKGGYVEGPSEAQVKLLDELLAKTQYKSLEGFQSETGKHVDTKTKATALINTLMPK